MLHQRNIVRQRFTEAKSRVEHQPRARNACRFAGRHPLVEIAQHFPRHILIAWALLHGFGHALHMHQADAGVRLLRQQPDSALIAQRGHIVDYVGIAMCQRLLHHRRAPCIEADRHLPFHQFFQHRLHPCPFFLHRHGRRARTRGFTADIENIRPAFQQGFRMR